MAQETRPGHPSTGREPAAPSEGTRESTRMSNDELDRIDVTLRLLSVPEICSPHAKAAIGRFNARIEQERSRVHVARASLGDSGSLPLDLEVVLRAAAVMFTVERERIARRFRFVPLRVGDP